MQNISITLKVPLCLLMLDTYTYPIGQVFQTHNRIWDHCTVLG
jgi:hypothetical protein